jgi:hypothetical protein
MSRCSVELNEANGLVPTQQKQEMPSSADTSPCTSQSGTSRCWLPPSDHREEKTLAASLSSPRKVFRAGLKKSLHPGSMGSQLFPNVYFSHWENWVRGAEGRNGHIATHWAADLNVPQRSGSLRAEAEPRFTANPSRRPLRCSTIPGIPATSNDSAMKRATTYCPLR